MSYYNNYQNYNSTNSSYLPVDTSFSNYSTDNKYTSQKSGQHTSANPTTTGFNQTTTGVNQNRGPYITIGRVVVFICLCLMLSLFIMSIVWYTNGQACSQYVTATIANTCGSTACCTSDGSNTYTCNLQLNYTVDGVDYSNIPLVVHGSTLYMAGQTITVCYSSDDAKQISLRGNDSTGAAIGAITISSILLLLVGYLQYRVLTNPTAAYSIGTDFQDFYIIPFQVLPQLLFR